jgi:hypothetical protein
MIKRNCFLPRHTLVGFRLRRSSPQTPEAHMIKVGIHRILRCVLDILLDVDILVCDHGRLHAFNSERAFQNLMRDHVVRDDLPILGVVSALVNPKTTTAHSQPRIAPLNAQPGFANRTSHPLFLQHDLLGNVLAVKGSLSPFGPMTAPGAS